MVKFIPKYVILGDAKWWKAQFSRKKGLTLSRGIHDLVPLLLWAAALITDLWSFVLLKKTKTKCYIAYVHFKIKSQVVNYLFLLTFHVASFQFNSKLIIK